MFTTITRKVEIVFTAGVSTTKQAKDDAYAEILTSLGEIGQTRQYARGWFVGVTLSGTSARAMSEQFNQHLSRAQAAGQRYAMLDLIVR